MYLLLGNSRLESGDYIGAIQLFERARVQTRYHASPGLSMVSLVSFLMAILKSTQTVRNIWQVSGWKFDDLAITVRQRLCEALYTAGRIKEAGECLLAIVNTVDEDVYMTGPFVAWMSGKSCYPVPPLCIRHFTTDFLQRCLSNPESSLDITLHSPFPVPLLREWAKLKLTGGSWRDALGATFSVSSSFLSTPRGLDTPLVKSLQPRDSQYIGFSAITSK